MKKSLFISGMILCCIQAFPQIDNPALDLNHQAITSHQTSQINADNTSAFNPVWANRFQTVLDSIMDVTGGKGASVAVYTPEEGLWTGISGTSGGWTPITEDMRFGIGSNTKLFIAVAMAKLHEDGVLSLDDSLEKWLPSFQHIDPTATIRQMLSHQSGFYDYWNDVPSLIDSIWPDTNRFWTSEELIDFIGPPHFAPGNGYRYSNTNYVLSGMIMEEATGKTWVQVLHDIIFDPLDLDSTFVGAYESNPGPVAAEWDAWSGTVITNSPMTAEYSQGNACGGILSTPSEMVQWYNALFDGEIIANTTLDMVLSFDPSSYAGLGIFESGENPLYYYHTGGMLGYISLAMYDTRRDAVIVMMFNDRESDIGLKFNALLGVFFVDYPKRPDDAGIASIIDPWSHYCSTTLWPQVELTNFGYDSLTSVTITYYVDGGEAWPYDWTGSLQQGETEVVSLPWSIYDAGDHTFTCYTSMPNENPDGYSWNDTLRSDFYINESIPLISGLYETFDGTGFPHEGWMHNSSSIYRWMETSLTGLNSQGACVKNNFDFSGTFGRYHDLVLPLLDITGLYNTDFSFDYAYASFPGYRGDSLHVSISEDCGETWETLFYDGGLSLRTAPNSPTEFYPAGPDDWEHLSYSLEDYTGEILIRFRARYGAGNNLYIDNILIGSPVGIDEEPAGIHPGLNLTACPNPFTQTAIIEYRLDSIQMVTLAIYDYLGQQLTLLVNAKQQSGTYRVDWNAEGLPSGLYFVSLRAGNQRILEKMVLLTQ